MRRALDEYHVGGIRTNLAFHRRVMRHPPFLAGDYDTGYIERHKADLQPPAPAPETVADAAIAAALHASRSGSPSPAPAGGDGNDVSAWRRELLYPAWSSPCCCSWRWPGRPRQPRARASRC
jgi:acetyl/propionyl-CoA carboxylase alpha subunit